MPGKKTTAVKNAKSAKVTKTTKTSTSPTQETQKAGKPTTTVKKSAKKTTTSKTDVVAKKTSAATKSTKKAAKSTTKGTKKSTRATKSKKGGASVASTAASATEGQNSSSRTRYFKVIVDGQDPHGRFSGSKPKQAANKALTSILKTREKGGQGTDGQIRFSIIECTRGSKHKRYNYIGERKELNNPMKVPIGKGDNKKVIEYRFNNHVKKDKNEA